MGTGRRPKSDLDAELAQLEREIAAATGERPAPARTNDRAPRGRRDGARASASGLLRKAAAVAIIVIAVAIALKIAFGFLVTFLWLAVGLAAVVAVIWAIRQL